MRDPRRVQTLPQRIAARRRAKGRRRGTAAGAAAGSVLATLTVAAFAVGDGTPLPQCPGGGAQTATIEAAPSTTQPDPLCPVQDGSPDPAGSSDPATADPATAPAAPVDASTAPVDPAAAVDPAALVAPDAIPSPTDPPPTDPAPGTAEAPATAEVSAEPPAGQPDSEPTADPAPTPVLTPTPTVAAPAKATPPVTPRVPQVGSHQVIHVNPKIDVEPLRVTRPPAPKAPSARYTPTPTPPVTPVPATIPTAPLTTMPPGSAPAATPLSPSGQVISASTLASLAPPSLATADAAAYDGPAALIPIYQAAEAQYGVPWSVLAAINEVETDFGRNVAVSSAGAVGWMQFMPSTWASYGVDGDGDGKADPDAPVDAIFAAARYLKASGAPEDLHAAVLSYNHAEWYVDKVLTRARTFADISSQALAVLSERGVRDAGKLGGADAHGLLASHAEIDGLGRAMLLDDDALGRRVLDDADVYACGQDDIRAGRIDRRVLLVLEALHFSGMRPTVSSLECGHGTMTSSGNVSEHTTGTAVDIAAIDGTPILGHQGPGSIAAKVVRRLLALPPVLQAHQIISLMTFDGAPNTLAMADHADHVHVGFGPLARAA